MYNKAKYLEDLTGDGDLDLDTDLDTDFDTDRSNDLLHNTE